MLGEHGDTQFAACSLSSIGGVPLTHWPDLSAQELATFEHKVRNQAYCLQRRNLLWYCILCCTFIPSGLECQAHSTNLILSYRIWCLYQHAHDHRGKGVEYSLQMPLNEHEEERMRMSVQKKFKKSNQSYSDDFLSTRPMRTVNNWSRSNTFLTACFTSSRVIFSNLTARASK
jgi:hypothetical protein